jgi:hypothetical protein
MMFIGRNPFFFFDPGRSLATSFVALLFSVPWLLIALHRGSTGWAGVAAAIIVWSLFVAFHSAKWQIRKFREWLK